MSVKKPSQEEEEYFAKEEAARRHALAIEKARQLEQAHLAELREQHWMKCPKCGFDLEPVKFKSLTIDKCFHCNGTWLDAGELELLAGKDESHSILQSIVSVFKHEKT
jgi:hypothetical protein